MAFFTAIGTISNDIVRRETKNGVVTTFRLETGAPRGRKLWIDVECWGHLAGTVAHHGESGRNIAVSGALAERQWRDDEGRRRSHRFIAASHAHLLPPAVRDGACENTLLVAGCIKDDPCVEALGSGFRLAMTIAPCRRLGSRYQFRTKATLWRPAREHIPNLTAGAAISASGSLCNTRGNGVVLAVRSLKLFTTLKTAQSRT